VLSHIRVFMRPGDGASYTLAVFVWC